MRKNNKQVTTYFILFSLLLIGVVYAILQANLQINGTAKIKANTWDIHFNNIVVNENSVSIGAEDSAATIDPENNCKVDFEVTLSLPGDFYEFTIDVVNAGTIDGMIGTLNKTLKVNNEVVSEVPDFLNYSITYEDGVEIEENHKINAGTTETYKVRLEFKTDIEELPPATTISTSLEPQYIQADSTATNIIHYKELYDVFIDELSKENSNVIEYTGLHKDSFTVEGTKKIILWHSNDNSSVANIILDKWNVIFGGFCWEAFRTTDTGGVKLFYNGIPNDGKCNSNSHNIGKSVFNNYTNSLAYVGYMYNPDTLFVSYNDNYNEGSFFGMGVNYNSSTGIYTLTNTSNSYSSTSHYTCNNTTGSCSIVRYYHYNKYYVELSNGKTIDQAFNDMLYADNVNQTNSTIKTYIDTWYQNNMTAYTDKLEDVIFCNDRSMIGNVTNGWNPNGGVTNSPVNFRSNSSSSSDLSCTNETDQFSMSNPKAQLTYPIGLMTNFEMIALDYHVLRIGNAAYYLLSPNSFFGIPSIRIVGVNGGIAYDFANKELDVRPVVALKPGTMYRFGDGSRNNPYIVE